MFKLSDRLFNLRYNNRYNSYFTQAELAEFLHVSRVTYCRYENGDRRLSLGQLWSLADFYGVTIDYLVGRSDEPGL